MEFSVEPQTEPVFFSFPLGCPPTGGAVCSSHLDLGPLCPKLMSASNLVFSLASSMSGKTITHSHQHAASFLTSSPIALQELSILNTICLLQPPPPYLFHCKPSFL